MAIAQQQHGMALLIRELYHSSNVDRWYLARDPDTGRVFIRHQANVPSGGHVADIEVGLFLSQSKGLEQQELLRLIGALVNATADSQKTGAAPFLVTGLGGLLERSGQAVGHAEFAADSPLEGRQFSPTQSRR